MISGKGSLYPSEHLTFRDRATGVPIHQMTRHPSINHLSHCLQDSFTPDGRGLIFTSHRSGGPQLFEANFPGGLIRQLTDGAPVQPFSPVMDPEGELIYFVRGGSVWSIDRSNLEERCIASFGQAQLGECSLAGEWITASARQGSQPGLVVGRIDGTGWDFIPFSRTVIHPQFHPLEPDWIEFGADPPPRMHRVRRDGWGLACLHRNDPDEFVVHEAFLGDTGDLVFVVWPGALRRMDWTTQEMRTIAEFNAWHVRPNRDGTLVVCDTNHPDEGLFLVDAETGVRRQVCLSESSNQGSRWKQSQGPPTGDPEAAGVSPAAFEQVADTVCGPEWTHPHPCFSCDERYVAFTSDRTGHPEVYVGELGD